MNMVLLFIFIVFSIKSSVFTLQYYNSENGVNKAYFNEFINNINEKYLELDEINQIKFEESFSRCRSSIIFKNITDQKFEFNKNLCASNNPYMNEDPATLSGKLFFYDRNIIGLVTNSDLSIRFYEYNIQKRLINQIYVKYFHQEVPFAACTDKMRNIFIVFPDNQKIGKYTLDMSILNSKSARLKELSSITLNDYNPTSISCYDEHIYISERPTNIIRVYNKNLNHVRNIEINGVIISPHRALTVNQNIRIFADDTSGVAIFNRNNDPLDEISFACHFYISKNCIEDVFSIVDNKNTTQIYVTDSCDREIKQFIYDKNQISLLNTYPINGIPTSVISDENGYLFVSTSIPYKIDIFYPHVCNLWSRRQMK